MVKDEFVMVTKSMQDIEGLWIDPDFESSLIELCRNNWNIPISEVTNHVLATFIRQKLALPYTLPEAERRVHSGYIDESELYDDELIVAIDETPTNLTKN